MLADRHAHRPGRGRQDGVQAAGLWEGHRRRGARSVEARGRCAVCVPVHQLDQCILVVERRGNGRAATCPENETGLGAIDRHRLDLRIGQVLRERSQWCDRSKDSPPRVLCLSAVQAGLFSDEPADQLVDPTLVLDSKARAISTGQLRRKLGFPSRTKPVLTAQHPDVAHGCAATVAACSELETAPSAPAAAPAPAITAVRCIAVAAYTKAGACLDDTTTTRPPATEA